MPARTCPYCGAELKAEILGGLCPKCVLNKVMSAPELAVDAGAAERAPVDSPPPSAAPSEGACPSIPAPSMVSEKPGDRIGRYKLLQHLGEGGMGAVWMAEQTEPVRRLVALKVIKPGMDSKEVLARFEAERQALALMDHPNIAKVLDAGTTPTGRPYFAMDLVKGIPFMRYCDEQRLSVRERLELFIQVCQAVQHAHQKGIIHRDLKPSNVLVALYDGKPVPKVIDFGVAKATGQRLTERTLYTALGAMVGTLEYMSPEQAEFNQLDIDTRSDIYSLGVLLYELLTGTTPLMRETVRQGAIEEVLRRIREEEPPKPSVRLSTSRERLLAISAQRKLEPAKLTKAMRGELDWIVMKALEKDRNRRYETATNLALDLQHYLNEEPVVAGPPTTRYRVQKYMRKHRKAVAVAAGFVVLLAVAAVVSTGLALWANLERGRANELAKEEARQRQRAEEKTAAEARAKAEADQQRKRAEERESLAARSLYVSDMLLAEQALEQSNLGRARELLDWHRPQVGEPDLRGWEWRYLWKQCQGDELLTLAGHSNCVHSVAFAPNSRWLISASYDDTYRLWDLASGRSVAVGPHISENQNCALFSRDGQKAFTSCALESFVRVWEVPSLKPIGQLRNRGLVGRMALSPDGRMLATLSSAGVSLWSTADLKQILRAPPQRGSLHGRIAFAPDGRWLAFSDGEGRILVWDLSAQALISTLPGHPPLPVWNAFVLALAFTPDGTILVSSGTDKTLRLWEVASGREWKRLSAHSAFVADLAFSPDGKWMATASGDQTVKLWDTATWEVAETLQGHRNEIWAVAFAPDGKLLVTGSKDETVKVWGVAAPRPAATPRTLPAGTNSILLAGDSGTVLIVRGSGEFSMLDVRSWEESQLTRLPVPMPAASAVGVTSEGQMLVVSARGGSIKCWDLATMRSSQDFAGPSGLTQVPPVFSGDGRRMAAATSDDRARVWDVATRQQIAVFPCNFGAASKLGLSRNGTILGVGYWGTTDLDGTVDVWDVDSRRKLAWLVRHKSGVNDLVVDGSRQRIASASSDGTVKIWDYEKQRELATLHGGLLSMNSVALAPNGRFLAGGTGDGTVKLWDLDLFQEIATLRGHQSAVIRVSFLSDGDTLLSVSKDTILVWRVPSLAEIEAAEKADPQARWREWSSRNRNHRPAPLAPPLPTSEFVLRQAASPTNGLAMARLAQCIAQHQAGNRRKLEEAESFSRQAIEVSPDEPAVWAIRAEVIEQRGGFAAAMPFLNRALERFPASPVLWNTKGKLCERDNRLEEAHRAFTKGIGLASENPSEQREIMTEGWLNRSGLLRRMGLVTEAGLDYCRAKGFPQRDAQAKSNLIDLSLLYNAALTPNWHFDDASNDLAELPKGVLSLAGTPFDLRAIIQLGSSHAEGGSWFPTNVAGIRLGLKCRRLHFLHGAIWASEHTGKHIGHYVLHYADSAILEKAIVLGQDVLDWWNQPDADAAARGLVVAWEGVNGKSRRQGRTIRIFKSTWENPLPDLEIKTLDFVSAMTSCAPFLIAVTVEE